MDIDVESHLAAVQRAVSSLKRDGQSAHAVTLARSYGTTVDDLWDAVTNGERIARWFLPISGDLKLGGRYRLEGNAGGVITACAQPSHFALTWEFGGDVGWELGLMGLSVHLTQPNESKLDEAAFAASTDGKTFMAGSSEGWGQDSIAVGTDDDAARATARRTTAFYTVESAEPV